MVGMEHSTAIKRIGLFLLIAVALTLLLRLIPTPDQLGSGKLIVEDERFLQAEPEFNILIMGNSRPRKSLNASRFKSTHNIATPGESFYETYYRLEHLLEKTDKQFEKVVLPLGPGSFKSGDFRRYRFWKRYVNYLDVELEQFEYWSKLGQLLELELFPFRNDWLAMLRKSLNKDVGEGEHDAAADWSKMDENQRAALLNNDWNYLEGRELVAATAPDYVARTIELCDRHNVTPIYIRFPLTPQFSRMIDDKCNSDCKARAYAIDSIIDYSRTAYRMDFEHLFADSLQYFSDPQHLNQAGKVAFSRYLHADFRRRRQIY